jgi:hypothetical protein
MLFSGSGTSAAAVASASEGHQYHSHGAMAAEHYYEGGSSSSSSKGVGGSLWRNVLDNMFIEFLAALFIITAEIMYADWTDPWRQLIPAVVICGAMVCLKDGDCFFPDATPTVTLLMWSVGAYDNHWIQPCARILGQCVATGVAIAMWRTLDGSAPKHVTLMARSHGSLFVFETLSTTIEHMGAVYLFIPMLPLVSQGRVRAKHHHETEAPDTHEVMYAALAFAGIHWGLRLSFMGEMNPLVTVARACILWHEGTGEEMLLMLWGEAVGVLVAMVYILNYYAPRKQRKRHRGPPPAAAVSAAPQGMTLMSLMRR